MLNLPLGPVMMDLQGHAISSEEKDMLCHPLIGGVILFTRNFQSLDQLVNLIKQIKLLRNPALLVAVDHEGGRVQRFREGFTLLPALATLGKLYDNDKGAAVKATQQHAWLMATELLAAGIDFSFAPVLDCDNGVSQVIGDRAFHHDKTIVAELGGIYIQAMQQAGMATVAKHFPGHGAVKEDTHIATATDNRSLQEILENDCMPFQQAIQHHLSAIMPAHVIYAAVDEKPAGYSTIWVQKILREQLKFNGVIFSDDLAMQAAQDKNISPYEQVLQALHAGCDIALYCNSTEKVQEVLANAEYFADYIQSHVNKISQQRRLSMQADYQQSFNELITTKEWLTAKTICSNLLKQ